MMSTGDGATAEELRVLLTHTEGELAAARARLGELQGQTEEKLRDKDLRIAELESARREEVQRSASVRAEVEERLQEQRRHGEQYSALLCTEKQERREERKQYQEALLKEKEQHREEKSRLEEKLEKIQGKYEEGLRTAQEQHREEKTRLEAQLAAALGRNERMMQAFQEGAEREGRERAELARERDNLRDTAERDRQALAEEWKGVLELEKERAREREAELRTQLAEEKSQRERQEARHAEELARMRAEITEAQSQLRQQEARHAAERREMAETLPQRVEECRAREAAQRGERSTILFPFLRLTLLGRKRVGDHDTLSIGAGLYKLWKDYYKTGVISQAELRELLRGETQIDKTYLNIEGKVKWNNPHLTLPQDEVEPFYADVVSQLPKLEWFGIADLPSVKLYYDPAQPSLPPSVTALQLNLAPYTLEELKQIRARYPGLTLITVTTAKCTDWGETANIEDMKERQQRVKENLNIGMIEWV